MTLSRLLCHESSQRPYMEKPTTTLWKRHYYLSSMVEEVEPILDSCWGRYIYIHDVPSRFNTDILKNCDFLLKWPKSDMCRAILNAGLGPHIVDSRGILESKTWFLTHPNLLEVIFHNRMRRYECLTNDSSLASVIYVPFYAGLDLGRYLWGFNTSVRDSGSIELLKWLMKKPEWKKMWGTDHFFVVGRTTWDFRRLTRNDSDWGNNLMFMPQVKNMTILGFESIPWIYRDFAIPYPTNFHPSNDNQVFAWQNKVRRHERKYLFSFVGAPRPKQGDSIRGEIIDQCLGARGKCKWLDCSLNGNCDNPTYVMEMFQNANAETAYTQYMWHLPKNYTKYSVFIPEDAIKYGTANIENVLSRIQEGEVFAMREEVIRLIPKIIFANPMGRLGTFEDAFDIAVKGVLKRVEKIRKVMKRANA
ncbi:exostosin family protein [Actinidia rufa]|uniref:Exostosin family protein n=1 Tax=Actinidia rufa TaxID=165716 RepID=A0A7J0E541_9ERIC|nr:exostosin family protein [Actinidia rufa]